MERSAKPETIYAQRVPEGVGKTRAMSTTGWRTRAGRCRDAFLEVLATEEARFVSELPTRDPLPTLTENLWRRLGARVDWAALLDEDLVFLWDAEDPTETVAALRHCARFYTFLGLIGEVPPLTAIHWSVELRALSMCAMTGSADRSWPTRSSPSCETGGVAASEAR